MDRSDFGTENTNCALRFSERYLSKTEGRRLYVIDSDSRGDISAISLPIGNAPKSFSRWHKQTSCKPQLENKNNRMSHNSNAYQYYLIYAFIFRSIFILIRVATDLEPILGILGVRLEYTQVWGWTPVYLMTPGHTQFTTICLLACIWKVEGNQRPWGGNPCLHREL